ncbi:mitochondrial fission ELM1 family protein [Pseudoxanthomonas suwonensis]|uniref:mitochondrial fission ELM1 family protein n=1 Tax=Pseudoxanthomonas suwonensis TaxID=314722 RepID=UPI00138F824D|nr:mitochondrial fission ELM1 family protein [Pseudoxanthomonas suwonensis]KAF1705738.1 nucleoside-diphosphate sugar epimerase [Pseudoxanthomonas suwonensis]
MERKAPAKAWLLTDGNAGNVRQAEALAAAMGLESPHLPTLAPRAPWRWLAPRRMPGARHAFGPGLASALARGQSPEIAIGCGRQGALAGRLAREHGARAVQILDPRIDSRHWDVVVVPEHDRLRGGNVVTLLGSLNPVDDAWLERARQQFRALCSLPRPRTALLLGGPTRQAPWTLQTLETALSDLRAQVRAESGSLLATVSRRTPAAVSAPLHAAMQGLPGVVWEGAGANPYPGLLACADRIVCTPDSVNMLSEACATRAPVYVIEPGLARSRAGSFIASLQSLGRIRATGGDLEPFEVTPLRETARVADVVRERLGL